MRKIFAAAIACSLFACSNSSTNTDGAKNEMKAQVPSNMHGFTPAYSASFVMDSAKNTESVLALWKDWKDGDLSKSRSRFADSVSIFFADGSSMSGLTDDVLKNTQEYRNMFPGMEVTVDAVFATKSTDKNENFVTIWGVEISTDKNGKKDTTSVQEVWRFNPAGKVDFMMQATRKGMLPPPPAN